MKLRICIPSQVYGFWFFAILVEGLFSTEDASFQVRKGGFRGGVRAPHFKTPRVGVGLLGFSRVY